MSQGLIALSCLLGGSGAATVMSESRLPVLEEYRFMDMCINGDPRLIGKAKYGDKEDACGCIVAKAIEEVDLTWNLVSDSRFDKWMISSMNEAQAECR